MSDDRFPLGVPVNRAPENRMWRPIPGRPGWMRHVNTGKEVYVEPPARAKLLTS